MWLSLSAPFSLSRDPRFSTKDDQNTGNTGIYPACEILLSKQVTGLYCGLRLTRVNWSCRVSLHGVCREQAQVDSLCMSRSPLVQTQKVWCAPLLFNAKVSWEGWARFICIYTLATFLSSSSSCRSQKNGLFRNRKMGKIIFLMVAMLFLKSVKLISSLGTGWWVLGAFWQVLRSCLLFYFFASHLW